MILYKKISWIDIEEKNLVSSEIIDIENEISIELNKELLFFPPFNQVRCLFAQQFWYVASNLIEAFKIVRHNSIER